MSILGVTLSTGTVKTCQNCELGQTPVPAPSRKRERFGSPCTDLSIPRQHDEMVEIWSIGADNWVRKPTCFDDDLCLLTMFIYVYGYFTDFPIFFGGL